MTTDQAKPTELLPERKEPEGFRLRVLNRNDLKLEDYYYLEDLLKRRTPSPAQPEWLPDGVVDEVQRHMDAVVDAAVAWATEEDEEFDRTEILSEAVDALLQLRSKPQPLKEQQ